jgi:pentatricopeptide repeat protein
LLQRQLFELPHIESTSSKQQKFVKMKSGFVAYLFAVCLLFGEDEFDAEAFQLIPFPVTRIDGLRAIQVLGASVAENNDVKAQDDSDRSKYMRETDNESPKQRNYSLNSDIYFLRKKRNGALLAQQRLETAIQQLIEAKERNDSNIEENDHLPDVASFNAVIGTHAKNVFRDRKAANRAEKLLRKMEDLSEEFPHLAPEVFTFNSVMEAYSKGTNEERSSNVKRLFKDLKERGLAPNTYTFNLLLASILPKSKSWMSLEKWALDFLQSEDAAVEDSETKVPDQQTYNTLFKVYGNSGAFAKAESLMRQIMEWHQKQERSNSDTLRPSRVWYHCIFKALAITDELDDDDKEKAAKRLLKQMIDLSKQESFETLHPDTETLNHLLNVYAFTGCVGAAETLLENMERSKSNHQPDCISYASVLKSFATAQQNLSNQSLKSKELFDLAERATSIFDRMALFATPNTVTCKWFKLNLLFFLHNANVSSHFRQYTDQNLG